LSCRGREGSGIALLLHGSTIAWWETEQQHLSHVCLFFLGFCEFVLWTRCSEKALGSVSLCY
jgi:hypothetical protein